MPENRDHSQSDTEGGTPVCYWCRTQLPREALVCLKCQRHQSRVWEYGKMLLTVSAVVGVLISAVSFSSERIIEIYDSFQEPEIDVTTFTSEGDAVITNTGRRAVKVSHIIVTANDPLTTSRTFVNTDIAKYESIAVDTRGARTRQALEENHQDSLSFRPDLSEKMIDFSRCSPNARMVVVSESSNEYQTMADYAEQNGSELNLRSATCRIFYSPYAGDQGQEFTCHAVLALFGSTLDYLNEFTAQEGKCAR